MTNALNFNGGTLSLAPDALVATFDPPRTTGIFKKKVVSERRYPLATLQELRISDFGIQKAVRVLPPGAEDDVYYQIGPTDQIEPFCTAVRAVAGQVAAQVFDRDLTGGGYSSTASASHSGKREVKVKSYKNEGEFQRDANRMMNDGWELEGQSGKNQKTAIGRTAGKAVLTGGIGLVVMGRSKKGDTITVTWVRQR